MTQTREWRPVPRDDRMWPRWAAPLSAVVVLAALTTLVVLLVIAPGTTRLWVALAFVAIAAVEVPVYVTAMRRVLEGHPVPGWSHLAQLALVVAGFVAFGIDREVGVAMFAGLFGGMFTANLWAIRAARSNRARVDEVEAELAEQREAAAREEAPVREHGVGEAPSVGPVLRHVLAVAMRNWLAWLVAGALILTGCLLIDTPESAIFGVVFMSGSALLWLARRTLGAWLAKRDFERAATEPRRAFVVLLHDPTPRMIRPLLGVWSEEPVAGPGRLPKPERVYRCDDDVDALECYQGSTVVHEAWVDTGKRAWSTPRWVAADSGIALPHRRAVFGRWFLASFIGGDRPDPAVPLTMPPPRPHAEAVTDLGPDLGNFAVQVGWRVAGLVAVALAFVWMA